MGLSQRKMYQLFDLAGLAGRRAVERARARGAQAKQLCSEMDQHGFCPWCPCPPPPCSGGHSGDQDAEWHCGDCRWRRRCACWDAALRGRRGWCEAHGRWRREREVRQATVARMQACAAACMNSPGGHPRCRCSAQGRRVMRQEMVLFARIFILAAPPLRSSPPALACGGAGGASEARVWAMASSSSWRSAGRVRKTRSISRQRRSAARSWLGLMPAARKSSSVETSRAVAMRCSMAADSSARAPRLPLSRRER